MIPCIFSEMLRVITDDYMKIISEMVLPVH